MTGAVGTSPAAGKGAARGRASRSSRVWTTDGVHPYDEVTWERRDVVMTNWRDGSINFEQRGVEFPDSWSVNAANIVTTKYFRGAVGTHAREWSLRHSSTAWCTPTARPARTRLLRQPRPTLRREEYPRFRSRLERDGWVKVGAVYSKVPANGCSNGCGGRLCSPAPIGGSGRDARLGVGRVGPASAGVRRGRLFAGRRGSARRWSTSGGHCATSPGRRIRNAEADIITDWLPLATSLIY